METNKQKKIPTNSLKRQIISISISIQITWRFSSDILLSPLCILSLYLVIVHVAWKDFNHSELLQPLKREEVNGVKRLK